MRASRLLGTAATAVVLLGMASSAWAKEELTSKNPWRDSEIDYEHGFSAVSLKKDALPHYNPYYVHRLVLYPHWHINEFLLLRAKLEMEQEFTDADDTKLKREVMLGDLSFDAATPGVTEPYTGIKVNGSLRFVFPTSKAAQATTLQVALSPGLGVKRNFKVLEGLELGYVGRFNFNFHQYTTAQQDAVGISTCSPESSTCGVSTGVRNAWGQLMHGPAISLLPYPKVSVSLSFLFINSFLYGLAGETVLADEQDVSVRHAQLFMGAVGYDVLDFLTVSLGFASLYGDLAPRGTYQTPFFNRFTQLSLGLALAIDPLIENFK